MTDWDVVPSFGEPPVRPGIVVRPSGYGILTNERAQIAVVRTSYGVFLPGGGLEPVLGPVRVAMLLATL